MFLNRNRGGDFTLSKKAISFFHLQRKNLKLKRTFRTFHVERRKQSWSLEKILP
jgi:hypothetical protein